MRHSKLRFMVECAVFAAVLCALSPVAVPMGPIPFTLQVFAVLLCGVVLPWRQALVSVLVYLALGLFLPIFSGGNTGLTALPGLTGGYIWSFVLMIPVIRGLAGAPLRHKGLAIPVAFAGCLLAIALCYLCGTLQFSLLSGRTFAQSLAVCVIPFIWMDLLKAVAASVLGVSLRQVLQKSGLL